MKQDEEGVYLLACLVTVASPPHLHPLTVAAALVAPGAAAAPS